MNRIFANKAKDSFGRFLDTARAARIQPIVQSVAKHQRVNAIKSEKASV